ncbi:MAG: amidohydrolase family protein [Bacteroidia bacterium]
MLIRSSVIILLFLCSCQSNDNVKESVVSLGYENNKIVFANVNFFDGENYFEKVNLILDGNSIVDITTEEIIPEGFISIDGTGKTIIPPLLNAHVHVWSEEHLKEAINAGVFALFDMHTTDEGAEYLRNFRGSTGHAYYYSSGPGATVPGGHGTQYGITVPTINSYISPRQFVEDRVRNNADYIKILREPYLPTVTFEQTKIIIEEAHKNNKLCVAHVSRLADAMELNSQGIDGFVHIWADESISEDQLNDLNKDLFVVPTLYVLMKSLASQGLYNKFDDVLKDTYKIYKRGIPILAGTDAPNFNFNYGDDLYMEVELLHKAGIPNIDVLRAATSNIYNSFKLKKFETLKKGSKANFILINGNPVERINDIKNIENIWQNGIKIK